MKALLLVFSLAFSALCCAAFGFPIKGTVVDANGKPVAEIKVVVTERHAGAWDAPSSVRETVVTDKAGAFVLKTIDIKPGAKKATVGGVTLVAVDPGALLGWRSLQVGWLIYKGQTEELAKGVKIIVTKPGTVQGKVTDESGKPVVGAKVECQTFSSKEAGKRFFDSHAVAEDLKPVVEFPPVFTDENGVYSIPGIPANMTPRIYVGKPGLAMKPTGYHAPPSPDVVLVPGGSLSGRVVDEKGNGQPGALVSASGDSHDIISGGWGKAITGKDGAFFIDGLVPNEYRLTVYPIRVDHIQFMRNEIRVTLGQTVKLPDVVSPPSVNVTGRVLDADTDKPIPNAQIDAGSMEFYGPRVTSDGQGRYKVPALPGEVRIGYAGGNPMYLPDYRTTQKSITVPAAGLKDYNIRLKGNGQCRGVVVGPDGKPLANAAVSIGSQPQQVKAVTNAKGEFALGLPPNADLSGG